MCAFVQLEHQAFSPPFRTCYETLHVMDSTPDVTISPRVVTKPKVASIENNGPCEHTGCPSSNLHHCAGPTLQPPTNRSEEKTKT